MADQVLHVKTEDEQVREAGLKATAEQAKRTPAELASLLASGARNNTRDPVEEEKRNNERMYARDRLARSEDNIEVEKEVNAKLLSDASLKLAEAQAAFDAVQAAAAAAEKHAVEETKRKDAEEKARDATLKAHMAPVTRT